VLFFLAFINSLPFNEYKFLPSWGLLIATVVILVILFLVIVNEVFDRLSYAAHKKTSLDSSFYLVFVSSDLIFSLLALIPSLGIRVFNIPKENVLGNKVIYNNLASSKKGNLETEDKKDNLEIEEPKQNEKVQAQLNISLIKNNLGKMFL